MKKYIVKPEFIDLYGSDATPFTEYTDADIDYLADEWSMPRDSILEQLIELKPSTRTPLYRFAGKHSWQEVNELVKFNDGLDEPMFLDEDDYNQAVKEGFVGFDGYYTTIYED